jgi:hypothetical protein
MNELVLLPWVAWRSQHRIHFRTNRPGFESRQGIRFLLKCQSNAVVYNRLNVHCLCVEKDKFFKK